ncbi:MAG: pantetheine-phosphate adenylyltransferase [Candidatus Levybacteria bacterium]|nr:pantetheine-phosphate adenylyltransferase [Candidatus Levybacteria bacterium]
MKKFKTIVLGGTFDHFHKGHESFLKHGLSISGRLIVGVTSDAYVGKIKNKKSKIKNIESYGERKKSVENFLNKIAVTKFEIIRIYDMFGTTLDKDFYADAILVSKNTRAGAEKINGERIKRGLHQFKIIISPQILAEDKKPISSFRIRNGEIDRRGKLYVKPTWLNKTLFLPQDLRDKLKDPWGKLIVQIDEKKLPKNFGLTAVGDETAKTFNNIGVRPTISIIDFKVARKKKFSDIAELGFSGKEKIIEAESPAGAITAELFLAITQIFRELNSDENYIIKIKGEDDLSVLPLILAAPLKFSVFYGQPNQGIIYIKIDEEIKNKAYSLVSKFITRGY